MGEDGEVESTARFGLASAPGGLCLVQELLNSASLPAASLPDLLTDESSAQSWVDEALRLWGQQTLQPAPSIVLGAEDLAPLRELRHHTRACVQGEADEGTPHPLHLLVSYGRGGVVYAPEGTGSAAVASLVGLETFLAAHTGALRRLKTCLNPACGAAFYDLSRNGTRVWHDMKTCGNTMNLRASRARRREAAPS